MSQIQYSTQATWNKKYFLSLLFFLVTFYP
uniref:Uncharacterized protein n=1 Tax=Rhizophora mucronata TaxID=61149 RepID=A0A2P2QGG8_RHIMU